MMSITYLRVRPGEHVNELWAATRRREGTIAIEVPPLDAGKRIDSDLNAVHAYRVVANDRESASYCWNRHVGGFHENSDLFCVSRCGGAE